MAKLLQSVNAIFKLLGIEEITIEDAKPVIDEVAKEHLWHLVRMKKDLEHCAMIAEYELWMIIQDEIKIIDKKIDYIRGLKSA